MRLCTCQSISEAVESEQAANRISLHVRGRVFEIDSVLRNTSGQATAPHRLCRTIPPMKMRRWDGVFGWSLGSVRRLEEECDGVLMGGPRGAGITKKPLQRDIKHLTVPETIWRYNLSQLVSLYSTISSFSSKVNYCSTPEAVLSARMDRLCVKHKCGSKRGLHTCGIRATCTPSCEDGRRYLFQS